METYVGASHFKYHIRSRGQALPSQMSHCAPCRVRDRPSKSLATRDPAIIKRRLATITTRHTTSADEGIIDQHWNTTCVGGQDAHITNQGIENQPRHDGTVAASALPMGTLLGPPPLVGGLAPGFPLAPAAAPAPARVRAPIPGGFAGTGFFASLEPDPDDPELVPFALPAEVEPKPGASFRRFTLPFSKIVPARVRAREACCCGAGAGAALAFPLSLSLFWVPGAGFRAAAGGFT